MDLSPDQFSSLQRVVAAPAAKVSAVTGVLIPALENLIGRIEALTRRRATALGSERLLLIHEIGKSGGSLFDDQLIAGLIRAKTLVVKIGDDASMVGVSAGPVTAVSASVESEAGPCMTAICSAGHLTIFAGGKPLAELGSPPPSLHGRADWQRPWRQLRQCMDDHFKHCIDGEKYVRYWSDKSKRILLTGPDGTEKLFHHSLFWWLKHLLSDALDVYGETVGMGQNKTDIIIVTEVGIIVIEVKWMGKNQSNTMWKEIRIREGLEQVSLYLANNDKMIGGYVVLYDARPEDIHKKACSYPATCVHPRCEAPVIYFLPSETPSIAAARAAVAS